MSNIEKKEDQAVQLWNDVEKIRQLFAPKLSNLEFQFFLELGKSMGANPFKKEIWCIKYKDNVPATIFLGRDFYRKVAQTQPDYATHRTFSVFENDKFVIKNGEPHHEIQMSNRGKVVGAYAQLFKKNVDIPYIKYINIDEYFKGGHEKKNLWDLMPATMIEKVAEAQVLRMAYQDVFSGTYSEDEQAAIERQFEEKNKYKDLEPPVLNAEVVENGTDTEPDPNQYQPENSDKWAGTEPKETKIEKGKYQRKISSFLKDFDNFHLFGDDPATLDQDRLDFLYRITTFEDKKGKTVEGVRKLNDLTDKRAMVSWHKIEKEYNVPKGKYEVKK